MILVLTKQVIHVLILDNLFFINLKLNKEVCRLLIDF